jgi:ferredoxin
MKPDDEGFSYPVIDSALCVECGVCRQVCPTAGPSGVLTPDVRIPVKPPQVYAAWNLDHETRLESTSGGLFSALAGAILEAGGAVAGARYAGDFAVEHHIVQTKDELASLLQSKYSQSTIGDVYSGIKELLEHGRPVLFCGTPCQNAGLRSFLGKNYENLYRCDFICRGVNSPKVFQLYLSALRSEYGSEIKRVWFKNKSIGWNRLGTKVIFQNEQTYFKDWHSDPFIQGYLTYNLYCRPSCHHCHFKGLSRPVDITLADFWGIGDKSPALDDNNGTSMVLLHSAKGAVLFDSIRSTIFCEKRETADALFSSAAMTHSIRPGGNRRPFFENIDRYTFPELMDRYGVFTLSERILMTTRSVYRMLKSFVGKAG